MNQLSHGELASDERRLFDSGPRRGHRKAKDMKDLKDATRRAMTRRSLTW